jgi:hypothetical protein
MQAEFKPFFHAAIIFISGQKGVAAGFRGINRVISKYFDGSSIADHILIIETGCCLTSDFGVGRSDLGIHIQGVIICSRFIKMVIAVSAAKSPGTLHSNGNLVNPAALLAMMVNTALHMADGCGHVYTPCYFFSLARVYY